MHGFLNYTTNYVLIKCYSLKTMFLSLRFMCINLLFVVTYDELPSVRGVGSSKSLFFRENLLGVLYCNEIYGLLLRFRNQILIMILGKNVCMHFI